MEQKRSIAWWSLPVVPLLGLAFGLWSAPAPALLGDGTSAQRERAAATVRAREPSLRRRALEKFPADPWSQGDDFANAERSLVRSLSTRLEMRPGAVLEAIDADVKATRGLPPLSGFERGQVPPCMPRVFYF